MKYWVLLLFIAPSVFSSPMDQMGQRVKVYGETRPMNCEEDSLPQDQGLFIDVSCNLKCLGKDSQIERVRSPFIPRQLGLQPGNGSNNSMILWGGLNVSLKMWSDKICLEKASLACKDDTKIESFEVSELQSGGWKVKRLPGCQEKEITLSPFYDDVKADLVPALAGFLKQDSIKQTPAFLSSPITMEESSNNSFEIKINKNVIRLPHASDVSKDQKCDRIISANVCFGDCIDMSESVKDIVETLGTPEPLGRETVKICGDALYKNLSTSGLTPGMKKSICESYFWSSLLNEGGLSFKTCAATRGDVDCQSFIAN